MILLALLLTACPFVTDADWNAFDADGDGYAVNAEGQGEDCDDHDPAVHPEADEACNGADDDCDGEVDDGVLATFYGDGDGDGWGNAAFTEDACTAPEGYVADGTDCDDGEALTWPGAAELCDGADNDCDGEADDDVQYVDWYRDSDEDGYGDPGDTLNACAQPAGFVADGTDCDDGDGAIHPEADEVCDHVDNDCDELTDFDDPDMTGTATWYQDVDGDEHGDPSTALDRCEPPSGYVAAGDDCDDTRATVHPGAAEVCGGLDDDCDAYIDEDDADLTGASTWYADADGDGYGVDTDTLAACEQPSSHAALAGDCDDTDNAYNPGVAETDCADPADYNCDGATGYDDLDGDGWAACEECDDGDTAVHPGATELCNAQDDDCDGVVDEDDAVDAATWCADADGDGYGDAASTTRACAAPAGFVADATDCDDARAATRPGATEWCNGLDDDCDGTTDEDDAADAPTWYADGDGDGYGLDASMAVSCAQPSGYAALGGDCDDGDPAYNPGATESDCADPADYNCDGVTGYSDLDGDGWPACEECNDGDAAINPDATEICDGVDNDCDGTVDEDDAADALTWYADADGDGYGDAGSTTRACSAPSGFVANTSDCDDTRAASHPGAIELCNTYDDDCDGTADEDDATDAPTWYADSDGDGYGDAATAVRACSVTSGFVAVTGDCDDASASAHPGAAEWCDGVDTDCDGTLDEGDALDAATWYADADSDSFGDPGTTALACTEPAGFVADATDCDDASASAHPGAAEWCDGVDDDCDGATDEDDAVDAGTWYADMDGDGFGNGGDTEATCTQPTGFVADGTDCDDLDGDVHPGATELCDGYDDDCDGTVDEDDAVDVLTWYADADGDGYGDATTTTRACTAPSDFVADAVDCDDGAAAVHPGAPEHCDALDEDCDGTTDEDAIDAPTWFVDADGDGYGDSLTSLRACATPSGYVASMGDCDDTDSSVNPGATERCGDGVDVDCDGSSFPCEASLVEADAKLLAELPSDIAGSAVAAGDIDGDGVDDLLIAAPWEDTRGSCAGAVYLVLGPTSGTVSLALADAKLMGEDEVDVAGQAVAVTDIDGDGFEDILVGAYRAGSGGGTYIGSVYAVLGPVSGSMSLAAADLELVGRGDDSYTGYAVTWGDLDGDGAIEIVVGAPGDGEGGSYAGAAIITDGEDAGTVNLSMATRRLIGSPDSFSGAALAAGDSNADGIDDLLVGAYLEDSGGADAGAAYLSLGPITAAEDLSGVEAACVGEHAGDFAGYSVSMGDLDGDGYDDAIVGAIREDSAASWAGATYVIYGPTMGSMGLGSANAKILGEGHGHQAGESIAVVDVDGDGAEDLIIGASGAGSSAGASYLVLGSVTGGLSLSDADARIDGESSGDGSGRSLAAGDMDGDRSIDLLVGAPGDAEAGYQAGAAFLVLSIGE